MSSLFDQPIRFVPLYKERVWGGRRLETDLGRPIPAGKVIGESWELVDRPDDQSIVADGPLAGKSLHELWTEHRAAIWGPNAPRTERFPLLAKILDCRETLSVQVHPPESMAVKLNGEPKTEMWYLLDAEPGAALYAGFRRGVGRPEFEAGLKSGQVEPLLHRISVKKGDAMFIPSGRCHAIGAGCLIVEIQQNSDTTYRVFDWNRRGLDGKPRELHIAESLVSMDFADAEPGLITAEVGRLADCECFSVDALIVNGNHSENELIGSFYTVISGHILCGQNEFNRGDSFLLPASSADQRLNSIGGSAMVLRSAAR